MRAPTRLPALRRWQPRFAELNWHAGADRSQSGGRPRGPNKVESLAAALGGAVITVVVTEVTTAHPILERA